MEIKFCLKTCEFLCLEYNKTQDNNYFCFVFFLSNIRSLGTQKCLQRLYTHFHAKIPNVACVFIVYTFTRLVSMRKGAHKKNIILT